MNSAEIRAAFEDQIKDASPMTAEDVALIMAYRKTFMKEEDLITEEKRLTDAIGSRIVFYIIENELSHRKVHRIYENEIDSEITKLKDHDVCVALGTNFLVFVKPKEK